MSVRDSSLTLPRSGSTPGRLCRARFLADLVIDEWLIHDRPDHWIATEKAKELQTLSRGKLTRDRADGLVAELIRRVHVLNENEDPKYAFKVDAVVLFGNYLSARDRIGDVDVALALRPRLQQKEAQAALEAAARSSRSTHPNFVELLGKPGREVELALRAKSSWLDIRDVQELRELVWENSKRTVRGHFRVLAARNAATLNVGLLKR